MPNIEDLFDEDGHLNKKLEEMLEILEDKFEEESEDDN